MENKNTLYIYIDESGNIGHKTNEPYFVICALMLNRCDFKPIKNVVNYFYEQIKEKVINKNFYPEKI